jgi:MFS superfamily sulfate permease-like transporter
MNHVNHYRKYLKSDLSSGLVVFLIALPLCLGISMASGAPLFAGIIAGILGGVLVGFLSNSHVNVSGPAASVALVVFTGITTLGSYEAVLVSVIFAGIVQILMGFVGAGTVAYFFPSSMIKGILASIGIILIVKQIPHSVGYEKFFQDIATFSFSPNGHDIFSDLYYMLNELHLGAILITGSSLILIILWDRPKLKEKYAFFKVFPAALAAVILGIILNEIYKLVSPNLILADSQLVRLPVATSVNEFFNFFAFPKFDQLSNPQVYTIGLSIAFIASLESLLSTEAGDKLDPYKRRTDTNNELRAQGIGNIASGLIGGLPITAVIVRTSANVSSGARTKVSTITHGTIMLVSAITIPWLLNKIPLASLSAVLFVVGYKLTSLSLFKQMYLLGIRQFAPFISTVIAVMLTDLIQGILVGACVSLFIILRDNYKTSYYYDENETDSSKAITIRLSEDVTFLNKASIMMGLENVPDNSTVVVDARLSKNIDVDVLEILEDFKETSQERNINFSSIGLEKFKK